MKKGGTASATRQEKALTVADQSLQVETWPIERLIPYARNARTHSAAQIEQLAASMKEFGWTIPILVTDDGTIVAGHGRLQAAIVLGRATAPVIVAKGWTEAQRRAYTIADNKLALNAGWDEALLRLELEDLQEFGALAGFAEDELKVIFTDAAPPESFAAFDENIEIEHVCPKCGYQFSGGRTAEKE